MKYIIFVATQIHLLCFYQISISCGSIISFFTSNNNNANMAGGFKAIRSKVHLQPLLPILFN
jgi:hypothetical protein